MGAVCVVLAADISFSAGGFLRACESLAIAICCVSLGLTRLRVGIIVVSAAARTSSVSLVIVGLVTVTMEAGGSKVRAVVATLLLGVRNAGLRIAVAILTISFAA